MTPVSPSDGSSLPPRHRPSLDELAKDSGERDLWDLEEDLDLPDDPAPPRPDVIKGSREIPAPREKREPKEQPRDDPAVEKLPAPAKEKIQINVNRPKPDARRQTSVGSAKPESDFADLDGWDDPHVGADSDAPETAELPPTPIDSEPDDVPDEPAAVTEVAPEPVAAEPPEVEPAAAGPAAAETDDEFSPVAVAGAGPVSLRPKLGLSMAERIGMISLVLLLAAIGVTAYWFSIHRLPREPERVGTADFPVRGELLTVKSARTYWRAPITDGPDADTVRRGTRILPVIEMEIEGGPAAIRVLFRDDEGVPRGDVVTRPVDGATRVAAAATDGFDDLGMHAAYRAGEGKPWTIEVLEGPSTGVSGRGEFNKVFEILISTDLR